MNKFSKYVIGIDGGGTKTTVALADLDGKILKIAITGPSSPRNVGIEKSVENISKGIGKVLKKGVSSVFIGLPSVQEEYSLKVRELKNRIKSKTGFKAEIGSDQLVAFRSGTDEATGVVLIAGTGCVAHGWKEGKEEKASGWGWLADEGSAVWAGRLALQKVFKDLDDRERPTILTKMVLKELNVSDSIGLAKKIYTENFLEKISSFSSIADRAAKRGDKLAQDVMRQAGLEAGLSANTVAKKLRLKEFDLVFVGSMFKSDEFKKSVEQIIKKQNPKVRFIYPKNPPVSGAVRLALKKIRE